jgi:hypothetical protein
MAGRGLRSVSTGLFLALQAGIEFIGTICLDTADPTKARSSARRSTLRAHLLQGCE